MNYMMVTSDPVITNLCHPQIKKKADAFPQKALELLTAENPTKYDDSVESVDELEEDDLQYTLYETDQLEDAVLNDDTDIDLPDYYFAD